VLHKRLDAVWSEVEDNAVTLGDEEVENVTMIVDIIDGIANIVVVVGHHLELGGEQGIVVVQHACNHIDDEGSVHLEVVEQQARFLSVEVSTTVTTAKNWLMRVTPVGTDSWDDLVCELGWLSKVE
jgi:hypothetical protein